MIRIFKFKYKIWGCIMKEWYNYDTDNPIIKDELRTYFRDNNIYYELSERFDGWHFEIKLDENEAEKATWFLESIIDTIICI